MRKFQCLLFVLKRSYICYYVICMTVPLNTYFLIPSWLLPWKELPSPILFCSPFPSTRPFIKPADNKIRVQVLGNNCGTCSTAFTGLSLTSQFFLRNWGPHLFRYITPCNKIIKLKDSVTVVCHSNHHLFLHESQLFNSIQR